ncbi:hypothetical protein DRW03_36370 [Corallococcus sp. H22C18031201]|nr:hypothetical protein [Citreicoccus inhibens]RJS12857.1 hypothetical protein DRW03_36370 [Corallococcus sp. H22C18031201]
MMPLHLFYDLDAPAREDARVTMRYAHGGEPHDRFETLREMLAWGALLSFGVEKMPQQCEGTFSCNTPDVPSQLAPLLRRLGFTEPVPVGPFCGLYERPDAVMVCKSALRDGPVDTQAFMFGGSDAGALRKLLGAIAMETSVEVKVYEWTPALR